MWAIEALAAEGGVSLNAAEAGSKLITDGGIMGAILGLALLAISVLYLAERGRNKEDRETIKALHKERDDEREAWGKQIHDMNNERFKEWREIMTAMNTSTAALQMISQSQVDRTATSNELAKAVSELASLTRATQASLDRNHGELSAIQGLLAGRITASLGGPK